MTSTSHRGNLEGQCRVRAAAPNVDHFIPQTPDPPPRLSQLAAYATLHGDCCVGFRDGDDPDLSRWANKQRADFRSGQLQQER